MTESPNKRRKQSPSVEENEADFVPLGGDEEEEKAAQYGYNTADASGVDISNAPTAPQAMQHHHHHQQPYSNNTRDDPRHAKDRPKSKHPLPGHAPWILVKTKFGRRFVHNTESGESFWRIPRDVFPAVREFEQLERQQRAKDANAKWAEEQLKGIRGKSQAEGVNEATAKGDGSRRRRRSESLQREDEEAMMAELAAQAEREEEEDVKAVVRRVEPLKPVVQQAGEGGYESGSSYEEVEVTDSEFEEEGGDDQVRRGRVGVEKGGAIALDQRQDDDPVEFGEDDIAYQLAAMGEDYGLDPASAAAEEEEADWEENDPDNDTLNSENAATLFRTMLSDHKISPFTPWETLIADDSPSSILTDDRYTLLPTTRSRKIVWEAWVKDTAARLKEERAQTEKSDPRIPYLAFLAEKATPKLYWPEFKRKYRKEDVMNDKRGLGDKEREKMYRDYIARLKLPEVTRKADLLTLLQSMPLTVLDGHSKSDAPPQQLLSHLHFVSLPSEVRDSILAKHIATLPSAPAGEDGSELRAEAEADVKREEERRRREKALADREREVEEGRRKAEKEERWARRDLRDEEVELRKAMDFGKRGLRAQLTGGEGEGS